MSSRTSAAELARTFDARFAAAPPEAAAVSRAFAAESNENM